MATLTLRIDDDLRDALQRKAEDEHVSLSELVRDLLYEATKPTRDDSDRRSLDYAPTTMSPTERHMFALLHRILGRVLPDDANDVDGDKDYQIERAVVLEQGYSREYWTEFAGISPELSSRDCLFVMDVLDMFRIARYSIDALRRDGLEVEDSLESTLQYSGFDHNDPLEAQLANYVEFLVAGGRWEEQKRFVTGPESGNSHLQMSAPYSRMLSAYRLVKNSKPRDFTSDSYLLNLTELELVAAAFVHPTRRGRSD